jgi:geranylgeranyl pyrophosphate synthase
LGLIARTGAIDATIRRAAIYAAQAQAALHAFASSPLRAALLAVADYTVHRDH